MLAVVQKLSRHYVQCSHKLQYNLWKRHREGCSYVQAITVYRSGLFVVVVCGGGGGGNQI